MMPSIDGEDLAKKFEFDCVTVVMTVSQGKPSKILTDDVYKNNRKKRNKNNQF